MPESPTDPSPDNSPPQTAMAVDLEQGAYPTETTPLIANGNRPPATPRIGRGVRRNTNASMKTIRAEARHKAWGKRLKEFINSREPIHFSGSGLGKYILHKMTILLLSNYVNVLLIFIPLGIAAGVAGWPDVAIFVLNFLAIIPLAAMLSFATEELAHKVGQTLGGLMNATFGNAVELIVSVIALKKGEIRIVQASMLGSILSNILLVLGMCFFFGGLPNKVQEFNSVAASTMSSLMAVATSSLIIPAALYATLPKNGDADVPQIVLQLSRGTSIIMLMLYVMYLVFQLKTHPQYFQEEHDDGEEEQEERVLNAWEAGFVLLAVTILVSVCADYLVGSIEGIVETSGISKTFIGLILIPIVGNAAEHVTAVVVSMKDKMDLAIGVALGSSMQIALLMTPFLVILGWIIGQPMSLHFQTFETVIFFISTYLAYHVVQDGKSNYLEGAMLLGIYFIIALSFYVYPDSLAVPPSGY